MDWPPYHPSIHLLVTRKEHDSASKEEMKRQTRITNLIQILLIIYRLLRWKKTKFSIKLAIMWIQTGLVPLRKCVILLTLNL